MGESPGQWLFLPLAKRVSSVAKAMWWGRYSAKIGQDLGKLVNASLELLHRRRESYMLGTLMQDDQ